MSPVATRRWHLVHKWTSLICTAFLLVICVTGLPLIFAQEIGEAFTPHHDAAPARVGDRRATNADDMVATARRLYPGQLITFISYDDDEPQVFMGMVPSFEGAKANPKLYPYHWLKFDTRTGEVINTSERFQREMKATGPSVADKFMRVMVGLHVDLYARLPGRLFLGTMGLLFVTAIVSGVVLYGPFTRRLDFGTVRTARSRRLKWLDLHNLLGVVTLMWALVVGVTGVLNEVAGPIDQLWRNTEVKSVFDPWRGRTPPEQTEMVSVQTAFDTARRALPGMEVNYVSYPNPLSDNVYHYWFWANGSSHLTEHLSTAVLIDARTGKLTKILQMPWYQRAVELSRPLHFGNYGGLPLKIIWALLDLATIVVLGSGLYLWLVKRRRAPSEAAAPKAEPDQIELLEAAE